MRQPFIVIFGPAGRAGGGIFVTLHPLRPARPGGSGGGSPKAGLFSSHLIRIMAKQRIPYFDFLRGAAILMVVAIHTFDGSLAFDSPASCAAIAVRQLLNCAVPVFLAVSGFFLSRKLLVTRGVE